MSASDEERPAFSLLGRERDATPPATATNSLYPYHEKALASLALAALALALTGPLVGQLPDDGLADRVMSVACLVFLWGVTALFALWPLAGERGIWRLRQLIADGVGRRLGKMEETRVVSLALYDDRLEWGQRPEGAHGESGSAPYSRIAYAVFYGDLLLVSFRMSPRHLPNICADASELDEEDRTQLSRFMAERVNAARRTRSYRRSTSPDTWARDISGRLVWGVWRCTAYALSTFFIACGMWILISSAAGEPALATREAICFGLFMFLVGLALLDGLGGRMLCFLRRHPTRRRFRVGRMRRRRPVG